MTEDRLKELRRMCDALTRESAYHGSVSKGAAVAALADAFPELEKTIRGQQVVIAGSETRLREAYDQRDRAVVECDALRKQLRDAESKLRVAELAESALRAQAERLRLDLDDACKGRIASPLADAGLLARPFTAHFFAVLDRLDDLEIDDAEAATLAYQITTSEYALGVRVEVRNPEPENRA